MKVVILELMLQNMLIFPFQAYSDMLTLSLIERYPSLETLRRMCNFFQVNIIEFFKVSEEEKKKKKN